MVVNPPMPVEVGLATSGMIGLKGVAVAIVRAEAAPIMLLTKVNAASCTCANMSSFGPAGRIGCGN